ncbi:hypothetical protein SEUCBS139899_005732 [Sporothrix eucalyptigena]
MASSHSITSRTRSLSFSPLAFFQIQLLLLGISTVRVAAGDNHGPPPPPPSAIGFVPSSDWAGIDGSWSTLQMSLGGGSNSPAQNVSVLVSTLLSEIWVVESSGCVQSSLCRQQRGGLFNIDMAETNGANSWQPLGMWSSALKEPGIEPPVADYGLAALSFPYVTSHRSPDHGTSQLQSRSPHALSSRAPQAEIRVDRALVGGINTTRFYVGYIGVGAIFSGFNGRKFNSLIGQLAEDLGVIPSHSYGYTAGASYRGGGTPASLTLGGFDLNRVMRNDSRNEGDNGKFPINSATRDPELLLHSVGAVPPKSNTSTAGTIWAKNIPGDDPSVYLTNEMNGTAALAVVDPTTPFLWLEADSCSKLASKLDLVWNNDLKLYQFSSQQLYNDYYAGQGPTFEFELSRTDNTSRSALIYRQVSSSAFALNATYPYAPSMKPNDPPVSYFPLQCLPAGDNNGTSNRMVLGRAIMQEIYMIMNYEAGHFQLHEAKFPNNNTDGSGQANVNLIDIPRSPNSPFPVFKGNSSSGNEMDTRLNGRGGLSTAATAGVVVGAFVAGALVAAALWLCRRRRRQQKQAAAAAKSGDDGKNSKDGVGSIVETEEQSVSGNPIDRIFSFIGRGRRTSKRSAKDITNEKAAALSPTSPTSTFDTEGDTEKNATEVAGSFTQPIEVGADAQHARYELPVPLPPVELDATAGGVTRRGRNGTNPNQKIDDAMIGGGVIDEFDDGHGYCDYDDATAILGNDGVQHLTAYELARRRMQRQLRGPVPTYEPPIDPAILRQVANGNTSEKSNEDANPVAHCRTATSNPMTAAAVSMTVSTVSSQTPSSNTALNSPSAPSGTMGSNNQNDTVAMLPSPITPSSGGWPSRNSNGSGGGSGIGTFDLPSPMTMTAPFTSLFFARDGQGTTNDSSESHDTSEVRPIRTAIDPERVVCLGPLPEGVVAPPTAISPVSPATPNIPRPPADVTHPLRNQPSSSGSESRSSPSEADLDSTLGTNYTLEEEMRLAALQQQVEQEKAEAGAKQKEETNKAPEVAERIDAGFDLVHVPQLAARRYSWEDHEAEGEQNL